MFHGGGTLTRPVRRASAPTHLRSRTRTEATRFRLDQPDDQRRASWNGDRCGEDFRLARLSWRGAYSRAAALGPCLVFPHYDWNNKFTHVRVRPSTPPTHSNGKVGKYLQPTDRDIALYIPPPLIAAKLHDTPNVPFIVSEGELKALCCSQFGLPCVSIPGVDCWGKKKVGTAPRELIDGLAMMKLAARTVIIIFDSDAAAKLRVKKAAYELAQALKKEGACVKWVALPAAPDGGKQGLDDYLVRHGVEALRELIESAQGVPRPNNGAFCNYHLIETVDDKGALKVIEEPRDPGDMLAEVREKTKGFPVAVGETLYAVGEEKLLAMRDAPRLFAWLDGLYAANGRNRVKWNGRLEGAVNKEEFFRYLAQNAKQFDTTSTLPHVPDVPSVLYQPYPRAGGDGTAFAHLMSRFRTATTSDGLILAAAFATPLWGGPPGARPAFLFEAEEGAAKGGRIGEEYRRRAGRAPVRRVVLAQHERELGRLQEKVAQQCQREADRPARQPQDDKTELVRPRIVRHQYARQRTPALHGQPRRSEPVHDIHYRERRLTLDRYGASGVCRCASRHPSTIQSGNRRSGRSSTATAPRFSATLRLCSPPIQCPSRSTAGFRGGSRTYLPGLRAIKPQTPSLQSASGKRRRTATKNCADDIRSAFARIFTGVSADPKQAVDTACIRLTPTAICAVMHLAVNDKLTVPGASSSLRAANVDEFRYSRRSDRKEGRWVWRGGQARLDADESHTLDYDPTTRTWKLSPRLPA